MRLNQFIARATGMSRRAADRVIEQGRVTVNDQPVTAGQSVSDGDRVRLDSKPLALQSSVTILLNKPIGYVCSRDGQGSQTIYDLLPSELHQLKSVGRLDKDSSGLLVLTNDGNLANQLTHPSYQKQKVYQAVLNKPLSEDHRQQIASGVTLDDGPSRLRLAGEGKQWSISMQEGRNRQIRRTFEVLGYRVITLHRTQFGEYRLDRIQTGTYIEI